MKVFQLTEHSGAEMDSRFYVDGVRVSRERMEEIKGRAYASGRLHSFSTQGRQMPGGRIRRTNYSTAQF